MIIQKGQFEISDPTITYETTTFVKNCPGCSGFKRVRASSIRAVNFKICESLEFVTFQVGTELASSLVYVPDLLNMNGFISGKLNIIV